MAARLSRRAAVFDGLATGVNSQTTGYLAGEPFTVHASTPSSSRARGRGTRTPEERICQAHCSVLRVRALGREPPGLLLRQGARVRGTDLENSIASASI
jgi:hypothetical protein